jgi:fatty acid desaturase
MTWWLLLPYLAAGMLTGALVVREFTPPRKPNQPPVKVKDEDRMFTGVLGLCAALAWPLVALLAGGAWLLWGLGHVFERLGRVR